MATFVFRWPFGQLFGIFKAPSPEINLYPIQIEIHGPDNTPSCTKIIFLAALETTIWLFLYLAAILVVILDYSKPAVLVHLRNPDLYLAVIFTLRIPLDLSVFLNQFFATAAWSRIMLL